MIRVATPLTKDTISRLKSGDKVFLNGVIYTARDEAHKRLVASLPKPPIELENQVIYYTGPTPAKPGAPIGSAGPTTSERMDLYTPSLLAAGLSGMIGKGPRSLGVIENIKKYSAVYFVATGGVGVLLSKCVKDSQLVAYEDLGCEAIFRLIIEDFPAYVGIDYKGNSITNQEKILSVIERTLILIKPDAVHGRLIGEVIKRFEEENFKILGLKMVHLDRERAERFYKEHVGKPFYKDFINFMTSGCSVAMVVEGEGVIKKVREMIGATDPKEAEWGTIRRDFATDVRHNIVHGSDSPEKAEQEINFFFEPEEIYTLGKVV